MQAIIVLLIAMATLSLLSTDIKASPVLPMGDDESSAVDLTTVEQDKEFKRICGMSFYCQRFKVKQNLYSHFHLVSLIHSSILSVLSSFQYEIWEINS